MTLAPWKYGKLLILDATCPDTLSRSYCAATISSAGAVVAGAEMRKLAKYDSLAPYHMFVPVAIKSLGVIGTLSMAFLKDMSAAAAYWGGEGPPVPSTAPLGGSPEGECHFCDGFYGWPWWTQHFFCLVSLFLFSVCFMSFVALPLCCHYFLIFYSLFSFALHYLV